LYDYFVPGDVAPKDVYNYLKEGSTNCVSTREGEDGRPSDYAAHTSSPPPDACFDLGNDGDDKST